MAQSPLALPAEFLPLARVSRMVQSEIGNFTWCSRRVGRGHGKAIPYQLAVDTLEEGEKATWYAEDFDDSGWKPIWVGEFWEEQGYPDYDGYGWYRLRFTCPPGTDPNRKFFLSFGRLDQTGTIWLNGARIGEFGGPWDSRFERDVTAALRAEGENLLAIRVFGGKGAGGLWAPIVLVAEKQ